MHTSTGVAEVSEDVLLATALLLLFDLRVVFLEHLEPVAESLGNFRRWDRGSWCSTCTRQRHRRCHSPAQRGACCARESAGEP